MPLKRSYSISYRYAFVPDIGMVGTAFVHRMANELVTYLDKAWLLIETTGSVDGVPDIEATSWGYSIPIGPICHGLLVHPVTNVPAAAPSVKNVQVLQKTKHG